MRFDRSPRLDLVPEVFPIRQRRAIIEADYPEDRRSMNGTPSSPSPGVRVKTHKVEMSLWFAAFRILMPDALTQNLRVASDTYTFMSLDPNSWVMAIHRSPTESQESRGCVQLHYHSTWLNDFLECLAPMRHRLSICGSVRRHSTAGARGRSAGFREQPYRSSGRSVPAALSAGI